jgi:signal transduction histidine kinase
MGRPPAPSSTQPVSLRARLLDSRWLGWLANLPPIAWLLERGGRILVEQAINKPAAKAHTHQAVHDPTATELVVRLQAVAVDVVQSLGYVGAMVAPYEQGDVLPVRAIHVDPSFASVEQIRGWEQAVSQIAGKSLSITNPELARVYIHNAYYASNLSVAAAQARQSVISGELFSLFTPLAPEAARPLVKGIQDALHIDTVIAVPFFAGDELVGNLFAAKQGRISEQERATLEAFGRQAAAAIESERSRDLIEVTQQLTYAMQSNLENETALLDLIVKGVVEYFDFAGAMVATTEDDNSLPVRSVYLDPGLATADQVESWQANLSKLLGQKVDLTDPDYARVYLNNPAYSGNLAFSASTQGAPVEQADLFSLFTPVLPEAARPVVKGIQEAMGIRRVIAVPFFAGEKLVGNLFAATRSVDFTVAEREALKLFGQQAAMGIRNARLYRAAENRREVAQVFGKMAFTSAAYLHELRNHVGLAKLNLDMLKDVQSYPPDVQKELLGMVPSVLQRLNQTTAILDHLHEPWRDQPDQATDVNLCIKRAVEKLNRGTGQNPVQIETGRGLPSIFTSYDMLIEVFRVIIKNALEAIQETGRAGQVSVESRYAPETREIEVVIRDNGTGIRPENLSKIFELKYTTKKYGMGFGLFWARDYVEGLGGSVEVNSEPGVGTTFILRFPSQQTGWLAEATEPQAIAAGEKPA